MLLLISNIIVLAYRANYNYKMKKMHMICLPMMALAFPSGLALLPSPCSHIYQRISRQCTDRLGNVKPENGNSLNIHALNNTTNIIRRGRLSSYTPKAMLSSIRLGYTQRLAADPLFRSKSILEIVLAAATQYTAEVGRRGKHRILPEFDFIVAGILTAVCGKYYSMWRVAKTIGCGDGENCNHIRDTKHTDMRNTIPTNAFQPTLLDGHTKPTLSSRFLSLLLPMPELFRAGFIASTIGYGLTSLLVRLRTFLVPSYMAPTVPVPIVGAAIYTGVFMAFVSNIRYQLLQGVIEPYMIEEPFRKMNSLGERLKTKNGFIRFVGVILRCKSWNRIKGLIIALIKWLNGLLGSWIAIGGMKACGLQKLRA